MTKIFAAFADFLVRTKCLIRYGGRKRIMQGLISCIQSASKKKQRERVLCAKAESVRNFYGAAPANAAVVRTTERSSE